jgi:uncharacterized protein YndB with AHSA1/START domain
MRVAAMNHDQEIMTMEAMMTAISESIEIRRRAEEVFWYAADPAHFAEWQGSVASVRREDAPLAVGSTAVVTRRVGPRQMRSTEQIIELNPPKTWAVRGIGGGLTAIATGAIEPLDDGRRSRVTIALDFEAHGIARLLLPIVVRRQARKQLPKNQQKLKDVLERSG